MKFLMALVIAGGCLPAMVEAQSSPSTDADRWHVRAVPYVWLAGQTGTMGIRGGDGAPVESKFEDIFKSLEFGFMAVAEVGKGDWSLLVDGMYVRLSRDSLGTEDQSEVDAGQVTVDAVAKYSMPKWKHVELYGGVRYSNVNADIEDSEGEVGSRAHGWLDPIVGVRVAWTNDSGWVAGGKADVGGFGVSSDLTWQIVPTLGYRFARHWGIFGAYRYLSIDYQDEEEGILYDIDTGGPAIGVEWSL